MDAATSILFPYDGQTQMVFGKENHMTYRVHGPTFVVEFLNSQSDSTGNPANHIHSAWRRIKGDFGLNGGALPPSILPT